VVFSNGICPHSSARSFTVDPNGIRRWRVKRLTLRREVFVDIVRHEISISMLKV
jgi:hypothetical protein